MIVHKAASCDVQLSVQLWHSLITFASPHYMLQCLISTLCCRRTAIPICVVLRDLHAAIRHICSMTPMDESQDVLAFHVVCCRNQLYSSLSMPITLPGLGAVQLTLGEGPAAAGLPGLAVQPPPPPLQLRVPPQQLA